MLDSTRDIENLVSALMSTACFLQHFAGGEMVGK